MEDGFSNFLILQDFGDISGVEVVGLLRAHIHSGEFVPLVFHNEDNLVDLLADVVEFVQVWGVFRELRPELHMKQGRFFDIGLEHL